MTSHGRTLVRLALLPVVVVLFLYGTLVATFATGVPDGLPWLVLGLIMMTSAGVLLGLLLRPVPASSRRRWRVVGVAGLVVGVLGLLSAAGPPPVSAVLRWPPLAVVFSPWIVMLGLLMGIALPVAATGRDHGVSGSNRPETGECRSETS